MREVLPFVVRISTTVPIHLHSPDGATFSAAIAEPV